MAATKTVSVPVTPGMREDLSAHMAPPGTITVATNVRFPVNGEVESRRGTTALSVATSADVSYDDVITDDGPDFLQPVPGGFVFGAQGFGFRYDFGKDRVHVAGSYSDAVPHGRFAVIAAENETYTIGDSTPYPLSVAVGGGYVAIVWSGGFSAGGITAQGTKVQIYTEGGTLVTTITDADYSAAWVLYDPIATAFILVTQDDSSGAGSGAALAAATITLASTGATLGSFVSVGTLFAASTSYWAACAWPGIGWALVYQSADTQLTLKQLTGTTTLDSETGIAAPGDNTMQPVSVYCDTTHVYMGWVDVGADNVAKARVYSTALVETGGGAITVYTDTGITTLSLTPPLFGPCVAASTAFLVVGRALSLTEASTYSTWMVAKRLGATGTLTSVSVFTYNMLPASAPFNNGMVWCRCRTPNASDYGNNYVRHVLVDFMNDRVSTADAARLLRYPRIALVGDAFADLLASDYKGGSYRMHLDTPKSLTNGHWIAGITRLVRSEHATGSASGWGLALAEWLEFATDAARDARVMGSEVVVGGSPVLLSTTGGTGSLAYVTATLSAPTTANQNAGVDLGFFVEPSIDSGSQSNTAGGALTLLGVYQYRRVLEWIDGSGRRWRSRPSRVQAVTMTGANDTVTFTSAGDNEWMRQKPSGAPATPSAIVEHYYRTTAGGSTFYRASRPQGAGAGVAAFVDTVSDGTLSTREILYTDGGVLDNDHPSSCRYLAIMEDRVWLGGLWDETQIQSSKVLVPGEPPQFSDSPAYRVVLPEKCTGLAAQDGILIAFCESAIYAVQGAGPNDQGQGAWESPRVVTRSTGCTNSLSILETSAGIFFQSVRGIEMIPRGMGEPIFIGAAVQDSLGSASVLSAAVIKSGTSSTARFCIGSTTILVYDLETGAWSKDTYPVNVVAICDSDEGAIIAQRDVTAGYGFLHEGGSVVNDSTGNSPVAVASTLQWADLRPFGIAGQGRFTAAIGLFDELTSGSSPGYQSGSATLFVTVDRFTDDGKVFDMAPFNSPDYRRHAPLQDAGTACVLKLTTAVNGWRFMGWTVELDQNEGGRRMAETEQG